MALDDLFSTLADATKGPAFDPEKDFRSFAKGLDAKLNDEGAGRLVDIVFRGSARLVMGYDSAKTDSLISQWLEAKSKSGISAEVIEPLRRKLQGAKDVMAARVWQSSLDEGVNIKGVEIRRMPTGDESRANPTSVQHGTIRNVHAIVRDAAAKHSVPLVEVDGPDLSTVLKTQRDFLGEQRKLKAIIPELRIPKTFSYREQKAAPTFPMVAKNCLEAHGRGKYFIETLEQWIKFEKWAVSQNQEDILQAHWVFQEYVEPMSNRPTSYRIFVDCLGNVMASQLLYGPKFSDERRVGIDDREADEGKSAEMMLEDPTSGHYLDSRAIASNRKFRVKEIDVPSTKKWSDGKGGFDWGNEEVVATDPKTAQKIYTHTNSRYATMKERTHEEVGGRITLGFEKGKFKPTKIEREILGAHNLDPKKPQISPALAAQAKKIARTLCFRPDGTVKSLYLGIDFIPTKDGNGVFLEANERPTLKTVQEAELLKKSDVPGWVIGKIIERLAGMKS